LWGLEFSVFFFSLPAKILRFFYFSCFFFLPPPPQFSVKVLILNLLEVKYSKITG